MEVSDTPREDSHDEKAKTRQGGKLNVNLWEDSQWADEVSEYLWEVSKWADDEVNKDMCKDFQDQKMKTQGGEVINTLPEELVERILAMVPFPFVFKARVLSKSWLARLSSISSQHDEEKRHLAISFQKQIRERCINWKTFCPILQPSPNFVFNAYDRLSHTWLRLPSLSFLPNNLLDHNRFNAKVEQVEGALLLLSMESLTSRVRCKQLYVANIFTQCWKELPPRPHGDTCGKTILSHTLEKYEVIHVPDKEAGQIFVEIYDSMSAAWTSMKVTPSLNDPCIYSSIDEARIAYLDGVLYFATFRPGHPLDRRTAHILKVMAINVKEETWAKQFSIVAERIDVRWRGIDVRWRTISNVHTVICNPNLLILIMCTDRGEIEVVKIDLQSRQVFGVAPAPPNTGSRSPSGSAVPREPWVVTDGDYIFTFLEADGDQALDGHHVLVYNVHEDKWDFLPYKARVDLATTSFEDYRQQMEIRNYSSKLRRIRSSFRPGLNPFVAL